jgi:2'-5' RNA ligase
MKLRLFIGIALDAEARAAIEQALQASARVAPPELRVLPADNWHLTLQFLGSIAEEQLSAVQRACAQAAAARAPFAIELGAAGAFKSPRSARVLWIGLAHGAERVADLYDALLERTEPLGFPREQRPLRAHLTIARAKQPFDARTFLGALHVPPLRMAVSALTLFRSHLSPHGARYEALEHFALGSS